MFRKLGDLVGTAGDPVVDAVVAPVQATAREAAMPEFSQHFVHLFGGRLAISLVRNTGIPDGWSARFDRADAGWFITLHMGTRFLNIDWV